MSKQSFVNEMASYAKRASNKLNGRLSWKVILTQWAHETGYGRSVAAKKHNNYAGIKDNSSGRDYDGGTYSGYNSINSFVNDYVRTMNLSYYRNVKGNDSNQIKELHKSPWATDPAYDDKMRRVYGSLDFGNISDTSGNDGVDVEGFGDIGAIVNNLSDAELKQYAIAGFAVVAALAIFK